MFSSLRFWSLAIFAVSAPVAAEWTATGSMDQYGMLAVDSAGVRFQDGRVLFAYGCRPSIFQPDSETWVNTNIQRDVGDCIWGSDAVLLNDHVLTLNSRNAFLLDTGSLRWRLVQPPRHFGGRLVALNNQQALEIGGPPGPDGSRCELYDSATESWTSCAPMLYARYKPSATVLQDGRVLVAGGYGGTASAEIYDPSADAWSFTAPLTEPRAENTGVLLPDRRVLIEGGNNNPDFRTSAEIYSPDTNIWSPAGLSRGCNLGNILVRTSDDLILMAGGGHLDGSGGACDIAEIFDWTSRTWTSAGFMSLGRGHAMGVALQDGRVLVAGGATGQYCPSEWSCETIYTLTAEMFHR